MTTHLTPHGLHDPLPYGYRHTVVVPVGSEVVLVAGQYASDETGAVVPGDFAAQVDRVVANLGLALAAHDLSLTDVVQLRTYVVEPDGARLGTLGAAIGAACGRPPVNTVIGVAALATPEILVEIEALAVR